MEMKLRNGGRIAVALVLCVTIGLAGCSTAWISEAEQIVAALIPAAANLLTLVAALQGKAVSAADLQAIQNSGSQAGTDLQLIQSLIAAYNQADAAAKPGIVGQLESAIQATQASLQGLLPALHIKDASTQAKITAIVGVLLSEVQSLAAVVPLASSANAAQSAGVDSIAKALVVKAPLSASQFVESYNATMTAKTGNADLDKATAGLKIHRHGKFARFATLGVLK
jgi:hypothetical protein